MIDCDSKTLIPVVALVVVPVVVPVDVPVVVPVVVTIVVPVVELEDGRVECEGSELYQIKNNHFIAYKRHTHTPKETY